MRRLSCLGPWAVFAWGLALVTPLATLAPGPAALAQPASAPVAIEGVVFSGLERTSEDWLKAYLDLTLPARLTPEDVVRLTRKLQTTGAFSEVDVEVVPGPPPFSGFFLHIKVIEKWTFIPVVRGVYGGGTPLRVVGAYDIHAFGRLLTLGGEMRKYGDAPPGFVLYGRDPRAQGDRYFKGIELWRDFRRRTLYDNDGREQGVLATDASIVRLKYLAPFGTESDGGHAWKYGGDLEVMNEAPTSFKALWNHPEATMPTDLGAASRHRTLVRVLPSLVYDDIATNVVEYDGLRVKGKAGPFFIDHAWYASEEVETFAYRLLPWGFNAAGHALIGQSSHKAVQTQYFLGGLDSIRGVPDGAVYGIKAAYANLEMRHLSLRSHYLWVQSVAFLDAGGAGETWGGARDRSRTTAGVGVRLAVPQIHRFILRVDYGWSLDGQGTKGITAGMNQFFDPFTPL